MLYGVTPYDPVTLAVVIGVVMIVAFVASLEYRRVPRGRRWGKPMPSAERRVAFRFAQPGAKDYARRTKKYRARIVAQKIRNFGMLDRAAICKQRPCHRSLSPQCPAP